MDWGYLRDLASVRERDMLVACSTSRCGVPGAVYLPSKRTTWRQDRGCVVASNLVGTLSKVVGDGGVRRGW